VASSETIAVNYVWRAYFHGGPRDFSPEWQPNSTSQNPIVKTTFLSPVFLSQASNRWVVGISSPIQKGEEILGVLTMTFEVGQIIDLPEARYQIPVLVNKTSEQHAGIILDHPLYEQPDRAPGQFVDLQFRLAENEYPERPERKETYQDPLSRTDEGEAFGGRWLAEMVPVQLPQQNTGWVVIVQEAYEDVIGKPFQETRRRLFWLGMRALAVCLVVSAAVWFVLIRLLATRQHRARRRFGLLGTRPTSGTI
jgi:hypothetical protein